MIKKTVRFLCVLLLSLQSAQSIALEDPVQMLQQVTHTVMAQINADAYNAELDEIAQALSDSINGSERK